MSDFHFGDDRDLWVYPPLGEDYEMPDELLAVDIDGQLFVDADDAIAQVRALQAENAKLQGDIVAHALNNGLLVKCVIDGNDALEELVRDYDRVLSSMHALCDCDFVPLNDATLLSLRSRMHDLGIEVE